MFFRQGNPRWPLLAASLAGAWLLMACGEAPKEPSQETTIQQERTEFDALKQETGEWLGALQRYGEHEQQRAIEHARAALAIADEQVQQLKIRMEENWDKMDASAREQATAALATLEVQQRELRVWQEKLQSGSTDAWAQLKQGFSGAYASFREALQDSESAGQPSE
ncbi:hypothetical protein [Thiorhodospira sibirica]|uniref:hypothetical protein n=1 Tax=Thiorhodospira sibirica TaxID=154347 RepID=UPI00022C4CA7|nr:hypothetical protein [Thiorhodospira sibirica]